ncbi:MAG TPA: TolC family protein, partial [Candidatus Babeliaceae bacterium]|nr:TolC family protein [Candidatus Babeliaceae bacterium]
MRKITITLITSLLMLQGFAQQASPNTQTYNFSLAECINYAYEHQDSIRNAKLDITSANYKVKETIGQGLPQINGSITFQDFTRAPASVGPDFLSGKALDDKARLVKFPFGAVQYNNTYSLQASQLLFSGSFLVGLQAVKTYKELSERNLTRSKIQTNIAVTKAYYQV